MAEKKLQPSGPDLASGIALSLFTSETLLGHVGGQGVLLVRSGPEIFAIDAHCSHYHGPLAEGLVVGKSIRCPWHHACFDLRTGEATRAPALTPLAVWQVDHENDRIFVRRKREQSKSRGRGSVDAPDRIVIVGGGAGRIRCGGDVEAAGVSRQYCDVEQRFRVASRSTEPVKGVSRRQRARRLAAVGSGQPLR